MVLTPSRKKVFLPSRSIHQLPSCHVRIVDSHHVKVQIRRKTAKNSSCPRLYATRDRDYRAPCERPVFVNRPPHVWPRRPCCAPIQSIRHEKVRRIAVPDGEFGRQFGFCVTRNPELSASTSGAKPCRANSAPFRIRWPESSPASTTDHVGCHRRTVLHIEANRCREKSAWQRYRCQQQGRSPPLPARV